MIGRLTRRGFLRAGASVTLGAAGVRALVAGAEAAWQQPPLPGRLVLNDDGHVFLNLSDDLHKDELRWYLQSYCRPGVDTVAYCVGDMAWPTLYPTRVGKQRTSTPAANNDVRKVRAVQNVANFAKEPGGYFGATFAILRELRKKVLASFRMNDAHFTSPDNPNASEFWRQHAKLALGRVYGYYGGCLNYVGCSPQTGQYLGLEEYRAAAANAYGSGADGIYLFNYPCLFELAKQKPSPVEKVSFELPDLRSWRQGDFSRVAQALDEIGSSELLRGKDKRFLFCFGDRPGLHRHYDPDRASLDHSADAAKLQASFRCYEEYARAKSITLRFKLENVMRHERFAPSVNGQPIEPDQQQVRYAANGRDTRVHTVALRPYLEYEISLRPSQLCDGENVLEVVPTKLVSELATTVNVREIELQVSYGG